MASLLWGIQYYIHRGIIRWSTGNQLPEGSKRTITALFILFNLPLLVGVFLRIFSVSLSELFHPNVLIPIYLWHFVSFILFLILMLGKLVKAPFLTLGWLLGKFKRTAMILKSFKSDKKVKSFDSRRRQVIRHSLTLFTGSLAFGSAYEAFRKDSYETSEIYIPIKGLPESFENFSIGFVSDIHSGVFMSGERMHSYAKAVNAMNTDMIVVTGDFVNSDINEVFPFTEAFGMLRAPEGVFGVLGNHDYYTRKVDEVATQINRSGMELLRNSSLRVRRGQETIILSGVDDTGSYQSAGRYFREVHKQDETRTSRILLCHRPYYFKDAASVGFDLVLAGHTHGGQVVLGEYGRDVLAPARIVSPYVAGLYTEGASQMYVSRGIGTVGVPFRFNCPPEITKIVLQRSTES